MLAQKVAAQIARDALDIQSGSIEDAMVLVTDYGFTPAECNQVRAEMKRQKAESEKVPSILAGPMERFYRVAPNSR